MPGNMAPGRHRLNPCGRPVSDVSTERFLRRAVWGRNLRPPGAVSSSDGRTLMSPASTARQVALDLIAAVLRRTRPLDAAIEDNPDMSALAVRDRAFARLLVATVLPRLGQI